MSDLIERYIHQVVHSLPPRERAEISAELRSSIQDQLDDRYGMSPSEEEITTVLLEMGSPHEMAESYQSDKSFIGSSAYPYVIMALRRIALIVPSVVIFLNIFGAVTATEPVGLVGWLLATLWSVVQATLMISAIVMFFFAILERDGQIQVELEREISDEYGGFDPAKLPPVDDPASIDRFEVIAGIVIGIIVTIVLLYFAQVGGLTLRFNLSDPGEVIPVSRFWLILLLFDGIGQVLIHLIVLRRNRWNVFLWLAQTLLELVGVFSLYFILYQPFLDRLLVSNPGLAEIPLMLQAARIFAVLTALPILIGRGSRQIRLWNDSNRYASAYPGDAAM